ncbi:MAG: hypothetical protein AAGH70_13400 [Pseudomonadota bacterium]
MARPIAAPSRIRAEQKKSTPTRTYRRAGWVGLIALILTGCEGVPAFSFASLDISRPTGRVVTQEVMLAGGLRVRAPFGKCVDTRRTRQDGANATVVLANCSNLGGRADIGAQVPGIILVTVTPGRHGDPVALREAIRANPGLLARSGQASDVQLLSATASSAALYVNLIDQSVGGPEGVSARHWKAALDIAGRAVVISVFGQGSGPLPGQEGERVARDVAQTLLEVNADTGPPTAVPIETPLETPDTGREGFLRSLLGQARQ